jgi:hypothetical protein
MPVTINGTTGITSPGGDTSTSLTTSGLTIGTTPIGAGDSTRFKNRIINGDMRIDQRNAGASVTPTVSGTYNLDRWQNALSVASKFSVQQNAGSVTPPAGFINYLGVTSLSAYSSLAGDYFAQIHNIEGLNVADLGWGTADAKTVTVSFWVRSSLTGTFGGAIQNSASNRSYPFTYTISTANTWTKISVTVAGDTSGTWLTTNGKGFVVNFNLGTGTTFSGTAGVWAATNYISATGAVSVLGTNGATFYITGVQLEVGSSATGFEYVDYTTQETMCQRYYWRQTSTVSAGFPFPRFGQGVSQGTTDIDAIIINLPTTMRTAPTLTLSNNIGTFDGASTNTITGVINANDSQTNVWAANLRTNGTYTVGRVIQLYSTTSGQFIAADAEL